MKKSRFSEEQIIGILKEHQAGVVSPRVVSQIRDLGCHILQLALALWRLGGVRGQAAEGARDENKKLKKLAESMLDVATLKEMLGKNVWSAPSGKARGSADGNSLRKCIRPLASGPLLRPGHDETRALRSHIILRAPGTAFYPELTIRRSTVSSSLLDPCNLSAGRSQAMVGSYRS
jgi:putative transposase